MVRFDRPCCSVAGALDYFSEHVAKGDYLTQGGEVRMVWYGKGAEMLGLAGEVLRSVDHNRRLKGLMSNLSGFGVFLALSDVSPNQPFPINLLNKVKSDERFCKADIYNTLDNNFDYLVFGAPRAARCLDVKL